MLEALEGVGLGVFIGFSLWDVGFWALEISFKGGHT